MGAVFVLSWLLFAMGIIYPAVMIAGYPIYKLFGGRDSFRDYMRGI